jgi:hypothetical protein
MSTVEEIKAAFEKLSLSERAKVAQFVNGWRDDAWDTKMRQDLASGKLDQLLRDVDSDIDAGRLEEGP